MEEQNRKYGHILAVLAYTIWGLSPIFWKMLEAFPFMELFVFRIFWSFIFIWIYLFILKIKIDLNTLRKKWHHVLASSVFITFNWILYIYSINNGYLQDASLGYYINPLVSVFLGMLFLKEKLANAEWIALISAGIGVTYLSIQLQRIPWISFVLALTFGFYGLFKKRSPFKSVPGLALELTFILPVFIPIFFLIMGGIDTIQHTANNEPALTWVLIVLTGPVTAVPLIFFGKAAGRIKLSAIGFLQFIAPTLMLLISILVFKESFPLAKLPGFIFVWIALVIYVIAQFKKKQAAKSV
jgi:chloramphenicol-sensitive protein RarD